MTNLEKRSLNSKDKIRFNLESLKNKIMNQQNLEKCRKDFDDISRSIRSKGRKDQKWNRVRYTVEQPINYRWMKKYFYLEYNVNNPMETTLYLELWQGNTKKYLYKLIRNRNNNFTTQKWTYFGDPRRPETYDFDTKTIKNLNNQQLVDIVNWFKM